MFLSKDCLPLSSFLFKDQSLSYGDFQLICRSLIDRIDGDKLYSKSTNFYVTLTYKNVFLKFSVVVYICNLSIREAVDCSFKPSQGYMVSPCL